MATITPTITNYPQYGDFCKRVRWLLGNADVGVPVDLGGFSDRSVHVSGTFGGATIVFKGSNNDSVSGVVLTDPQGNAITKTSESIEAVTELTQTVWPESSGGTGTAVIVDLFMHKVYGP